jgi:hypothetical protein
MLQLLVSDPSTLCAATVIINHTLARITEAQAHSSKARIVGSFNDFPDRDEVASINIGMATNTTTTLDPVKMIAIIDISGAAYRFSQMRKVSGGSHPNARQ